MIGGEDIVVRGRVAPTAPGVVRRYLADAWPDAVVRQADVSEDARPLGDRPDLWRVPAELLVYRTAAAAVRGLHARDASMVHILFDRDAVTIVVDRRARNLARGIRAALHGGHGVSRRVRVAAPRCRTASGRSRARIERRRRS